MGDCEYTIGNISHRDVVTIDASIASKKVVFEHARLCKSSCRIDKNWSEWWFITEALISTIHVRHGYAEVIIRMARPVIAESWCLASNDGGQATGLQGTARHDGGRVASVNERRGRIELLESKKDSLRYIYCNPCAFCIQREKLQLLYREPCVPEIGCS